MPAPESEMTAAEIVYCVRDQLKIATQENLTGVIAEALAAAYAQGKAEGRAEAARDFALKFGRAPASSKE